MKRTKLPKSLTTVTPFSKFLALSMFIVFPIIGFYLGIAYEKSLLPKEITSERQLDQPIFRSKFEPTATPVAVHSEKLCTMEAKQCPDGSYVGRTGPNCEFTACPSSRNNPSPTCIPRPACLDAVPRCMIAETENMCPKK